MIFTSVLISFLVALILPGFETSLAATTNEANNGKEICLEKSCISTASKLLDSIDPNADPCEDFYQYACGGWIDSVEIPDDKSSYGTIQILQDKLHSSMKQILESRSKQSDKNIDAVNKLVNVYAACVNETVIEQLGIQAALDFLAKNAPWPAITDSEFNETAFVLVDALPTWSKYSPSNPLIQVYIWIDDKNSSRYITRLDQPSLGLPSRDYFLRGANDTAVKAYLNFMTSVAKALQKPNSTAKSEENLNKEMREVLEFEIKVAHIMTPREDQRDPNKKYNLMTIRQLSEKVPGFDWLKLLKTIFSEADIALDDTEEVIVLQPEYFVKLLGLVEQTPKRTIANYLGWRAIESVIEYLNKDLNKIVMEFKTALTGAQKQKPRWNTCVEAAMQQLDMAAARLYVEKHFDTASKQLATEMMTTIQQAFEQQLAKQDDWMDAKELEMAKQKSSAMVKLVAYPDKLLNDTWLTERHVDYVGYNDKHLENYMNNVVAEKRYLFRKLREAVDRYEFQISPATINAYYMPSLNIIVFLAAIMQPPYFSSEQPMSLNYGGIGTVMGHELTHGFDDEGRHYDADGKLNDWWSEKTADSYKTKTQCLIDQYNNFTIEDGGPLQGMRLNGITTQGENIADLGGLRQSYSAYQNWKQQQNSTIQFERRLPGLHNYTDEQLFFLGSAVSWCAKDRPEALKLSILSDPHSPEKYRITGPFANMPEFAQAFNCPTGSRMNPAKKCRVW